jgi:hypothetical protein
MAPRFPLMFMLFAVLAPLAADLRTAEAQFIRIEDRAAPKVAQKPGATVTLDDAVAFIAGLEKDNEDLSALWGVRIWPETESARARLVREFLQQHGIVSADETQRARSLLMLSRLELIRPSLDPKVRMPNEHLAAYLRAAEGLSTAAEGLRRVTLAYVLIQQGERQEARDLADSVLELPVGDDASRNVSARTGLEAMLARVWAEDDEVVRDRLLSAVERADVAGAGKRLAGEARLIVMQRSLPSGGVSEQRFIEAVLAQPLLPRQFMALTGSPLQDGNARAILEFKSNNRRDRFVLPTWLTETDPTPNEPLARTLRDLVMDEARPMVGAERSNIPRARVARAFADTDLRPRLATVLKAYADSIALQPREPGVTFEAGSLLEFMAPRLAECPPPIREQFWRVFDIMLANDSNFIRSGRPLQILGHQQVRADLAQYDRAVWSVGTAAHANSDAVTLWSAVSLINAVDRATGEFGYSARGQDGVRAAMAWYAMITEPRRDGWTIGSAKSADGLRALVMLASMLDAAAGAKLLDGSDLRRDLDAVRSVAWLNAGQRGKAIALAQPLTDVMPSDAATPEARAQAWNAWSAYLVALAAASTAGPMRSDGGPARPGDDDLRLRLRTLRAIDPEFGVEVAPRAAAALKVLWTELELSRAAPAVQR